METYQLLEREWAEFNELEPECMVVCSSGTAALHLALEAMRLPKGSSVLVPEFTMVACARSVTLADLTPRFVDCRKDNLLLDIKKAAEAIENGDGLVSAIMPVHVYGRQCNMDEISVFSEYYGLAVVEDLAEAHGIRPHKNSDAACWSFYKNKIVAGEEGGAVWFQEAELADYARRLRSLGFTDAHDFTHLPRGHNYRMANVLACVIREGYNGLRHYPYRIETRRQIEEWYNTRCNPSWKMPHRQAPWVYDLRIPGLLLNRKFGVDFLVSSLHESGIEARHGFKPMSWQPEYAIMSEDKEGVQEIVGGKLPWEAAKAASEVLYLPMQPGVVTEEYTEKAFEVIRKCMDLS